jgi:1,4-alpha-glucan branching enzyme
MFAKGKKKGTVQFSFKPEMSEAKVYLAGGFRSWQPLPMKKQKDGRFTVELPLARGEHEYKFVVGGQWITDPDHSACIANSFGTKNSVARVE